MPSRCIFFFRALRACSTLLSRTNTCKCFPIVLLSLLWSGDPDDFRVTRPIASMSVCAQEENGIQEPYAGPPFLNEQHRNHSDSHRVARNRADLGETQRGRSGGTRGFLSLVAICAHCRHAPAMIRGRHIQRAVYVHGLILQRMSGVSVLNTY